MRLIDLLGDYTPEETEIDLSVWGIPDEPIKDTRDNKAKYMKEYEQRPKRMAYKKEYYINNRGRIRQQQREYYKRKRQEQLTAVMAS